MIPVIARMEINGGYIAGIGCPLCKWTFFVRRAGTVSQSPTHFTGAKCHKVASV